MTTFTTEDREALEKGLEFFETLKSNEPVAWMELYKGKPNNLAFNKFDVLPEPPDWTVVPLYTHPVKELTDEEIEQVRVAIMGVAYWCADENMPEAYNAIKVCCAQVLGILVKAQEK